jgi:hypothetical protein
MINNKKIIRFLGLLILLLFVMEYLEPSTVGVRIGQASSPNPSETQERSSSFEKNGVISPHAMIWDSLFLFDQDLSQGKFKEFPKSVLHKLFSKEIFHPPLLSI